MTAAALPSLSLHGLRRSFGTLSEWGEVPAGIVAQIMGHKTSAIAEKHYIQRELDLLHLWHVKIEAWILDDCGLRNIWLKNGYQYEVIEGHGKCLEIADINGLHRSIAHQLVNYRKRLSGAEIRFLRGEMDMAQKRLADCLGVDEQTVSLWERSKRRPTVAAERMLRLLYLEHADGKTKVAQMIVQWNDTDRQELEEVAKQVFQETDEGWRMAS